MRIRTRVFTLSVLCSALFTGGAFAADADSAGEPGRSAGGKNPLKNVYFGEQHLHTENSPDAFVIGVRQTWDEAYQWALGKEVKLSTSGETNKPSPPQADGVFR
jgi:hypothetical protein